MSDYSNENFEIKKATSQDIQKIRPYLNKFRLDSHDLNTENFYIAVIKTGLAAFGRVKVYGKVNEICSVGVLKEYRNIGLGKAIIKHLINISETNELWVVTKIPEYFEQFGFKITKKPPDELVCKTKNICNYYLADESTVNYMKKIFD